MATEKLKFKIELYSTFWDKPPVAEIKINKLNDKTTTETDNKNYFDNDSNKPILNINPSYFNEKITSTKEKPTVIEFEHSCEDGKDYQLIIDRSGKSKRQTMVENGKITKDQLLHIKSIEIDEIDIGSLIYEGVYRPAYLKTWAIQQKEAGNKLPETLKNSPDLGHNGTWTFTFSSPFYMWLLENLY